MLRLPVDILAFIIDKSEVIKPKLCIACFRDFGLHHNCNHLDISDNPTILKFKLVCRQWNKAILNLLKNKPFHILYYNNWERFDFCHATVHLIDLLENSVGNLDNLLEKDSSKKNIVNMSLLKKSL